MTKAEVAEKINAFLAEEFEVDISVIQPDAIVKDALELDSLDYVDIVVLVEANFGFKVQPEDFAGISTFDNFYDYVLSKAIPV